MCPPNRSCAPMCVCVYKYSSTGALYSEVKGVSYATALLSLCADGWGLMICHGTLPPTLRCTIFVLRWLFRACITSGSSPFGCALCCVCVSGGHQEHGSVLGADDAAARGALRLRCRTAAQRQVCVCVYTHKHTHTHTHTHQSCFCMRARVELLTRSITRSVSRGVCFRPFCDTFKVSLGLF
jgi:hypothetical protein